MVAILILSPSRWLSTPGRLRRRRQRVNLSNSTRLTAGRQGRGLCPCLFDYIVSDSFNPGFFARSASGELDAGSVIPDLIRDRHDGLGFFTVLSSFKFQKYLNGANHEHVMSHPAILKTVEDP